MANKEVGLKIEDWMGVNRQETREQIQDNAFWTLQNLYERKIGELQRRGGSQNYTSTAMPSNISGIDSDFIVYDKLLGKTKILKVSCTPQTSQITNANVSAAFVTDVANGKWGSAPVGITNAYIGCVSPTTGVGGIQLIATGFGLNTLFNAPMTANLPASGDTKKLQVTISGSGVNNSNITGLDIYAQVITAYYSGTPYYQWMWVGHIDVSQNPTGTYTFDFGPITLGADPGSGKDLGSTDTTWTLGSGGLSGSFVSGKTYYVAVLAQRLVYSGNVSTSRSYWFAQSVKSYTIPTGGIGSISINKTGGGSAGALIAIGTHPQLMKPYILGPNSSTWGITLLAPPSDSIAGCINYIPSDSGINDGYYIFNQADFGLDEMFAKVDSNNVWQSIPINNWQGLNGDISIGYNSKTPGDGTLGKTVSSGGTYNGCQYFSQTQELLYMVSQNLLNPQPSTGALGTLALQTGITANSSSSSPQLTGVSNYQNLYQGMVIVGPGIPVGTMIMNSAAGAGTDTFGLPITQNTVNLRNENFGDVNATLSLTGGQYSFYPYQYYAPQHNIVQSDGHAASMSVMDWQSGAPPQFSFINVYQEHLLGAGGIGIARNKLFFANPQLPYNWNVPGSTAAQIQYVQVESAGEDIVGVNTYTNTANLTGPIEQLLLSKRSSLWVLTSLPVYTTSSANNAVLTELSRKAGCANTRTIVNTEMGTIVTGIDNVWLVRGTGEPTPIGDEIKWFLRSEDPTVSVDPTNWSAVYHDGHYKLAFSAPGSSVPNQELWLNLQKMKKLKGQPCWYGPMVGRECWRQMVEIQFNDTIIPIRWSVDVTNKRWYWADREDFTQDFSSDLSFLFETKILGMQDDTANKLYNEQMWRMKVDQSLTFTETLTALNQTGEVVDQNSRTVAPLAGYTSSNYANFVTNCRAKLNRFFVMNRGLFGENIKVSWAYTGPVLFTIAGFSAFYLPVRRRPGLSGG